jgi:hypothetical protein
MATRYCTRLGSEVVTGEATRIVTTSDAILHP